MFRIYSGSTLIYEPGDPVYAVFDPKLTVEMGKAGSLEFTVPSGHPFWNQFQQLSTPVSVELDGKTIFDGRVLTVTRTFSNQREVYCEGILSYLVDSVQKAEKFTGKAHTLFEKIINTHNSRMPNEKKFYVGNIAEAFRDRDVLLTGQEEVNTGEIDYKQIAINSIVDNWNNSYDYIETCLISYCGGYLMTRKAGSVTYLDWVEDYTNTASQEIEFGENMLDLTEETSAEDLFTVLIPLGDDNLTIKDVNGGSDELVDAAAVAKYGRIVRTQVFNNVNQASTLLEDGRRYLAQNVNVPQTLTITALDMHLFHPEVTSISLGDRVFIRSSPHDISKYLTCTKIEYDMAKPENTVYTFGREKQTLTQRYREDKRKESDTYGNGADGDGISGIGASASALGSNWKDITDDYLNKSKEETEKQLEDFYDAWVDFDEGEGTVTLGALYKKVLKDETVLENNVGINMDAPSGTINIFADHQSVEETKNSLGTIKTVLNNNVGIDLDAPAGTINIFSDHNKITESVTDIGTIKTVLNQNAGLNVDAPAGTVSIFSTATIANNASDKADSAQSTANDASTKTARIIAWAGEDEHGNLGSRIALEADLVTVSNRLEAVEGVFNSITANRAAFNRFIYTPRVYAGSFYIDDGSETVYNMKNHTHSFRENVSDGTVHIEGADWTGADHFFNIADTTTYKNAVSAVSLSALAGTTYTSEDSILSATVSEEANTMLSGNMIFACFTTELDPTGKTRTIRVGINAAKAVSAASASLSVASITSARETTDANVYWDAANQTVSADFNLSAKNSNGNTLYTEREHTITIPAAKAYNAGATAKTPASIRYGTYSDDGTTDYGTAIVTLSDGSTVSFLLSPNAYNEGRSSGYTLATNSITDVSYARYSEDSSTDYGHINITFSDGTIKYRAITPNAYNTGYTAGYEAGTASSSPAVASITAARETTDGNIVWNATDQTLGADYTLHAKDSSGNTIYSEIEYPIIIPAAKAYNAGAQSVAIDNVASTSDSTSTDHSISEIPNAYVTYSSKILYGTVNISLSNGKTESLRVGLNANKAYDAGALAVNLLRVSRLNATSSTTYTYAIEDVATNYDNDTETLGVKVRITLSNNTYYNTLLNVNASKAYDAGFEAGQTAAGGDASVIASVAAARETTDAYIVYDAANKTVTADFNLMVKDAAGNTIFTEESYPITIPAYKAFNAVEVRYASLTATRNGTTINYSDSDGYTIPVNLSATATNNSSTSKTVSIKVTDVYTKGYDEGRASVSDDSTVSSISASRETADGSIRWDSSAQTLTADYTLYARNASSSILYREQEYPISIPATRAYNAGWDYGAATIVMTGASTSITNTHSVESGHHYVVCTISPTARTTTSSGSYRSVTSNLTGRKITADAVYNDGQDYGAETVSVTGATIGITSTHSVEDGHHYVICTVTPTARAIKSDGSYATASTQLTNRRVTADAVYQAGYDAGAASVAPTNTLDRIGLSTSYNSSTHKYSVVATAYDKNNIILMSMSTATNTDAYDYGWSDGYSDGTAVAVSVSSVGYEQDENGSTDWNYIWVRLSNGTTVGNLRITPNGYTTGWNAGYKAGSASSSGSYQEGYNKGYDTGYSNGYSEGYRQGIIDVNRVTSITVTATNSSSAGIRAYHSDGGYGFRWVSIGDYWNGY